MLCCGQTKRRDTKSQDKPIEKAQESLPEIHVSKVDLQPIPIEITPEEIPDTNISEEYDRTQQPIIQHTVRIINKFTNPLLASKKESLQPIQIILQEPLRNEEDAFENIPPPCDKDISGSSPSFQVLEEPVQLAQASVQQSEPSDDDDRELSEQESAKAALYRWAKETHKYCTDSRKVSNVIKFQEEVMQRVQDWKILSIEDQSRTDDANKDGGKQCMNKRMASTIRAIGKQIIKQVGKKVLSGQNIPTISRRFQPQLNSFSDTSYDSQISSGESPLGNLSISFIHKQSSLNY